MTETTGTNINSRFKPVIATQAAVGYQHGSDLYLVNQDDLLLIPSRITDKTAKEFKRHEKIWNDETRHISSPIDKYLHPSYARIIGLGWPAVNHILRSLQKRPTDWFYALRAITNTNPVPDGAAGDVKRMADLWIQWGKKRGLV